MPDLIELTHAAIKEKILQKYTDLQASLGINYIPNLNDDEHLLVEAIAYQMLLLKESFNFEYSQLFLQNATNEKLDALALSFFNVKRTISQPTAQIEIEIKDEIYSDFVMEKGFKLYSEDNTVNSILLNDLTITPIDKKASGVFELQITATESEMQTIARRDNLPIEFEIRQLTNFRNGNIRESDERLRQRCWDSLHLPSTAGTKATYEYHARTIDSRIRQVKVDSPSPCIVAIYFYTGLGVTSPDRDSISNQIRDTINAEILPTSILLQDVIHSNELYFDLFASIKVPLGINKAIYQAEIANTVKKELSKLANIGQEITLYQLRSAFRINEKILSVDLTVNLKDDDKNTAFLNNKEIICDFGHIPILDNLSLSLEYEEGEG